MSHTHEWRPNTCGCVMGFSGVDAEGDFQDLISLKACPMHEGAEPRLVADDNRRANLAIATLEYHEVDFDPATVDWIMQPDRTYDLYVAGDREALTEVLAEGQWLHAVRLADG